MIKDETNRIPELKKRLKSVSGKTVEVGAFGEEISLIASVNEWGVKIPVTKKMRGYLGAKGFHLKKDTTHINIPERSFLRSTFDDKNAVKQSFKFAQNILDMKESVDTALNALGTKMAAQIKKKIKSNIQPANHPFTTEQKGGKTSTLIDSGHLLNSVKHEIT
jgi:hypothetical protein